ncbi:MAG: GNAT family N-acetyltransferase [Pseudomonadota bacterium]
MSLQVRDGDPREAAATALLTASHALMESLFPSEDNHYLSIDALAAPGIHFYVAEISGQTRGCVALAERTGYGEVKSLFVDPEARGAGIGDGLMQHLIGAAQQLGLGLLRLETGNTLEAAHRLYERHGFTRCGPFGDYVEAPTSLFMELSLRSA